MYEQLRSLLGSSSSSSSSSSSAAAATHSTGAVSREVPTDRRYWESHLMLCPKHKRTPTVPTH